VNTPDTLVVDDTRTHSIVQEFFCFLHIVVEKSGELSNLNQLDMVCFDDLEGGDCCAEGQIFQVYK